MENNAELLVRVITVVVSAIFILILLYRKMPAGYAYLWTILGANVLVFLESLISLGYIDPWTPLVHMFMTVYLLAGSFLGHIIWLGYNYISKSKVK